MSRRPIILDCDPGHDDAIAILLAANNPELELLGITVSTGNQTLKKTARNALNVCDYLNVEVPVAQGAPRPLVRDLQIAEDIHGESGLDGVDFQTHDRHLDERHAVDFIIETLLQSGSPITMVTTGPMTNLAMALRRAPKIKDNIREVVLMGGSFGYGNVSPAAEFNILVDPEAAHIVFSSGLKVTMVGLDATRQVLVLPDIVKRMENINSRASDLFVKLMKVFNENQRKIFGLPGGPLHDPLTIAYLTDPEVLRTKHVHCSVDLSHGESHGRTNCDMFGYLGKEANTHVATEVDVTRFWDIVEAAIRRYD